MQTIHERISGLIKTLKCSEREFSTKLGHTKAWAGNLIRQESKLSHEDILKLKYVFAVNPLYLLEGQKPEFLK